MPNISITVKNKVARADKVIIVCDNSDYTAVFDFDDEWSAYDTKTVRFVYGGTYTDVVVTGNECPIPKIQDARSLYVGVYAGDLHTTTPAYISCVPSILCGNGIPADPTPDVYAQIMELLNNISLGGNPATTETLGLIKVGENLTITEDGVLSADQTTANNALDKASAAQATADTAKVNAAVAQTAANAAQATADTAQTAAADAQAAANTAQSTADNALLIANTQPDWNQNDSTQPDYVKNRPFYVGNPVETVLLEESTASFTNPSASLYYAAIPTTIELTAGETYKVSWDGTAYECVCESIMGYAVIGNPSIMGVGADTGDPFAITPLADGNGTEIYTLDTSASHTISISAFDQEVVKIDLKYLPMSTDDSYGVIKKSDIVSSYNFPMYAPHDRMLDAINAFNTGNASIVWDGEKVIMARYDSSNDTISVVFAEEPLRLFTYSNSSGLYNKTLGSDTYGELQGNQIRITNNNNVDAVLTVEGESSNASLTVWAERISIGGSYYGVSKTEMILRSSTAGSTKKFKITVDDSGTITATEVS